MHPLPKRGKKFTSIRQIDVGYPNVFHNLRMRGLLTKTVVRQAEAVYGKMTGTGYPDDFNSKHPRHPRGTPQGGQFKTKGVAAKGKSHGRVKKSKGV